MENTNPYAFDVVDDIIRLGYGKRMRIRYINDCFRSAYPNEYHWMLKNYGSFKLAKGIYNYMISQGRITHKQLKALKKFTYFG